HSGESIMVSKWPEYSENLAFEKEEQNFQIIMDAIRAIRNRRNEMNVPPSKKAKVVIVSDRAELFSSCAPFIQRLAYASEVECDDNYNPE
ncbi:MAG: class I tRNA ligase family protein, partial [Acutalibacteraceae bacterium]|nr:class I tRNA ligase family protein [Acutalibacteraceae bacterium]